jgi:hypothetical protein
LPAASDGDSSIRRVRPRDGKSRSRSGTRSAAVQPHVSEVPLDVLVELRFVADDEPVVVVLVVERATDRLPETFVSRTQGMYKYNYSYTTLGNIA